MNFVIMDLEWNSPEKRRNRIQGLSGDIIQIGAVMVNENLKELGCFEVTIKPEIYPKMHKAVTELTGITQDMVDSTDWTFKTAIESFRAWMGEDVRLITWSFTDMQVLLDELDYYGLDSMWVPECYDAQMMFDDQEFREGRNFALSYALFHFNERPECAHTALDDSRSTLKVMKHLDPALITDEYFAYFGDVA